MKEEVWKDCKHYENVYMVSNLGRVKSLKFKIERILSSCLDSKGYSMVCLRKNGIAKTPKVHKLVANTFLNDPLPNQQVNHKNGIKTDNRVENLEWCTASENVIHSWKNKLSHPNLGSKNGFSKLKEDDIISIRNHYANNKDTVYLSKKYNVSRTMIYYIINRKFWTHI